MTHPLFIFFLVNLFVFFFFFFNDTAPTEIYPLPLHAALPISALTSTLPPCAFMISATMARPSPAPCEGAALPRQKRSKIRARSSCGTPRGPRADLRALLAGGSEEHTSELQSLTKLGCRLLLVK